MRLRINDLITFNGQILRVQKLTGVRIFFAPHIEANVDSRDRDKKDDFKYIVSSASGLQKNNATFIHISPTGLISEK